MHCNHTASFNIISPVRLLLYSTGVRLETSTALCLLGNPAPPRWAICELLGESAGGNGAKQASAVGRWLVFSRVSPPCPPLGLLLVSRRPPYVQVWRRPVPGRRCGTNLSCRSCQWSAPRELETAAKTNLFITVQFKNTIRTNHPWLI